MAQIRNRIAVGSWAGILLVFAVAMQPVSSAASLGKLSGRILGLVTDASGIPQMGASVFLFNRQDKLSGRILTDENGSFSFDSLVAGAYSVRVSLISYMPVLKTNIFVQPGIGVLLNVSLAGLFSSVEVIYPAPEHRAIMSDDWKWVLRTSSATRPVLRLLPGVRIDDPTQPKRASNVFSDTHAMVKVSAGDGGRVTSFGNESDLGTAFALATSLGNNQLQFSGNFGYASQSGMPSAGFRTSYSRGHAGETSPEVTVTMRQLFVPGRVGSLLALSGQSSNMPVLKTLSISADDGTQLTDSLRFDYGFSMDSVTFFDRLNYLSPYARLTYALSDRDQMEVSFTSGVPRADKFGGTDVHEDTLQSEINALALFPRVSLLQGHAKVQRAENYEVGYRKVLGSRTYRAAAYRENISNTALTISGGDGLFSTNDVLPDLFSGSSVFNAGTLQSLGFMMAVTQKLGGNFSTTMMYGSGDGLLADRTEIVSQSPDDLRSMIRRGRRQAVTSQIAGISPWTGTQFIASYQWADSHSATPTHYYATARARAESGLNMYVRQPIRTFSMLPVRMEASADLRNLLAQGYLPFAAPEGRQVVLMHTPRSFRGGLSFIF